MDDYEDNDACNLARSLPMAAEGAGAVVIDDATLHHTDATLDTDHYVIQAVEGDHVCAPLEAQCYFVFDIAFTPPDVAAHETYEMCVRPGTCGGSEVCTTANDWHGGANRFELSMSWEGSCGVDDDETWFVEIRRNGGEESCEQYSLEYELTYTDEECA
jgi:hypothetical protein